MKLLVILLSLSFIMQQERGFKDEILAWINGKFNSPKTDILGKLKGHIKNELAEVLKEEFRKREELVSKVSVLHEHVHYYQNQVKELKCENGELDQYEKRLCVRVYGIPLVTRHLTWFLKKLCL